MGLYVALWRIAFQDAVQYRAEAVIWFLYDVLGPITMAFVWLAAYEGHDQIAGYDLGSMLLYTLAVMVLRNAITAHCEWDVDRQIRQGELSMLLVRPMNPWATWLLPDFAWRGFRLVLVAPVLLSCLLWLAPHLDAPSVAWTWLPPVALSIVLGYLASFFLKLCLGFCGFWLTDIFGLVTLHEVLTLVFGGFLLPLDLLPGWLRPAADVLPFQYLFYVPVQAAIGRLVGPALLQALLAQLAWTFGLGMLACAIWRCGLRRYEAVGG